MGTSCAGLGSMGRAHDFTSARCDEQRPAREPREHRRVRLFGDTVQLPTDAVPSPRGRPASSSSPRGIGTVAGLGQSAPSKKTITNLYYGVFCSLGLAASPKPD